MELKKEIVVSDKGNSWRGAAWMVLSDIAVKVSIAWTGICLLTFIIGIAAYATEPERVEVGTETEIAFSSDYGGLVNRSFNGYGAVYVRGCLMVPDAQGEETCREEWLYTYRLQRHYTPKSQLSSSSKVPIQACVFVERDGTSSCEPMWYTLWTGS